MKKSLQISTVCRGGIASVSPVNKAIEEQSDLLLNVAILGTETMDLEDSAVDEPRQNTRWVAGVGRDVLVC